MSDSQDREPAPDHAEDNAFFPSPYSLTQYVAPKTDYDHAKYSNAYKGGKWKILVVATQERYLPMADGKFFSTGNHPVETFVPLLHLIEAGFEVDIATLSGDPAKMEMWAFPKEDEAVKKIYNDFKQKLRKPLSLTKLWGANGFDEKTPYLAVFVPGGHGALNGIPFSDVLGNVFLWADKHERFVITLCHGPACLLSARKSDGKSLYEGYKITVFPDSLDNGANIDIGYIPGKMEWLLGQALEEVGVQLVNKDMSGAVHKDRRLLTGDSPLASNTLGKLAADTLIADAASRGSP
jgi:putative intracellular protease/amidase